MKSLYFFGYIFNGLEFIVYILIPTAMVLVILTYVYFNIELIKITFRFDSEFFDKKRGKTIECFKFDFEYDNDTNIDKNNNSTTNNIREDDIYDNKIDEIDINK